MTAGRAPRRFKRFISLQLSKPYYRPGAFPLHDQNFERANNLLEKTEILDFGYETLQPVWTSQLSKYAQIGASKRAEYIEILA